MESTHTKGCNCQVCNNGLREERQYAALRLGEHSIIFDVEEYQYFDTWIGNKTDNEEQPKYREIEPEDENALQLVYGVLIPAYEKEISDWRTELEKYKEYAFATLEDEKVYLSAYQDVELHEDLQVYAMSIPCTMLLNTSLNLKEKTFYGFGHTMFLKIQNLPIFDNILNREFLFCIRDVEESYDGQEKNWKQFVDKEKLQSVARELF